MPIKLIVFDCDGVILESVEAKSHAFKILASRWGEAAAKALLDYHDLHGGVSRSEKIKWLFKEVLKKPLSPDELNSLCEEFAALSLNQVLVSAFVPGFMEVLDAYQDKIPMSVASGAPHGELCEVLKHKNVFDRFVSVYGSPPAKATLLANIVKELGVDPQSCLMIGDSKTDLDAALEVGTKFYGRGLHFKKQNQPCAEDLTQLKAFIEQQI